MKVYWIKAQSPRRILALVKHHEAEMPLQSFRNIRRWIDHLMRLPGWADPWPAVT